MRKRNAHGWFFASFSHLDAILLVRFALEYLAGRVVMMLRAILALSVGLIGTLAWHGDAFADGVKRIERGTASARARYVGVHKRGYVRGYLAYHHRGGYSYDLYSVINTYGDARARYGGVNYYRDPFVDNQGGCCGPFDNGFFFDSTIRPHGGNSPYLN
jgi:hypothetical protein